MRDLRTVILDHIQKHGDFPDAKKLMQAAFGQKGGPWGRLQGHAGKYAPAVKRVPKPNQPVIRGIDIYKELGIK